MDRIWDNKARWRAQWTEEKGDWENLLWKAKNQTHLMAKRQCKGLLDTPDEEDTVEDYQQDECEFECKWKFQKDYSSTPIMNTHLLHK